MPSWKASLRPSFSTSESMLMFWRTLRILPFGRPRFFAGGDGLLISCVGNHPHIRPSSNSHKVSKKYTRKFKLPSCAIALNWLCSERKTPQKKAKLLNFSRNFGASQERGHKAGHIHVRADYKVDTRKSIAVQFHSSRIPFGKRILPFHPCAYCRKSAEKEA